MTTSPYFATRDGPRHFEPGERSSSFANSGLAPAGAVAHGALRNELKQLLGFCATDPGAPRLHGVLEGQLTRVYGRVVPRLNHEQADKYAWLQAHPQLFLDHRWCQATQDLNPQVRFYVADVHLNVPAVHIEPRQLALRYHTGIVHLRHRYLAIDFRLAHQDLIWLGPILLQAHPLRPIHRFAPVRHVIAPTDTAAAAKIGNARPMLPKQFIHTRRVQPGDLKMAAIQRIGEQHIPLLRRAMRAAKQVLFAPTLARMRADCRLKYRPSGQSSEPDQPCQRKAHRGYKTTRLRIARLVRDGGLHRDPCPVGQLHASTVSPPRARRLGAEQAPGLMRQPQDRLQGQPGVLSARSADTDALYAEAFGGALPGAGIDCLLARTIHRQGLLHERRQRHGGRIQPFPMLRQMRFGHLQQPLFGQRIREIDCTGLPDLPADSILMLPRAKSDITIRQGWSPSWRSGSVVTTTLQIWASLLRFFQSLRTANQTRWSLRK